MKSSRMRRDRHARNVRDYSWNAETSLGRKQKPTEIRKKKQIWKKKRERQEGKRKVIGRIAIDLQ